MGSRTVRVPLKISASPCRARLAEPHLRESDGFKDDAEVTGNEIGVNILNDGSLVLDHAQAMDAGQYVCLAENVAGNVTHDISLRVYCELPFRLWWKKSKSLLLISHLLPHYLEILAHLIFLKFVV